MSSIYWLLKKILFKKNDPATKNSRDHFSGRVHTLAQSYFKKLFPKGYTGEIFLCGGAFKPLLKEGLLLSDLDLWVRDAKERQRLATALEARGAQLVYDFKPYCAKYDLNGLAIEIVYHNVKTYTLLDLLETSDLALCAMGARYQDGQIIETVVHDECWRAICDREVRVLKDNLAGLQETQNPSILRSIHRIKRQRAELGYGVNPNDEHKLWTMFFQDYSESQRQDAINLYLSTMVNYKGQRDEEILTQATQPFSPISILENSPQVVQKVHRWLKEADYLRCHLAFRRHSNESASIQEHLDQTRFFSSVNNAAPQVLSVGCGSGEMDAVWLTQLADRSEAGVYTALDPNQKSMHACDERLRPILAGTHSTLHCVAQKYEDYHPPTPLDRIMFMHSLYHFPDREAVLRKAIKELSPHGKIMVCVSDDDGLSQYKSSVYEKVEMPAQSQHQPGADLRRILARINAPYTLSQTTAEIEVTECLGLTPDGISLLEFFFLCRFESLHEDQRAALLEELPKHCERRAGRFILHQTILFSEISPPCSPVPTLRSIPP